MNAKNLLKRAACLFSLTGLALSVSAQSRFADAMRQAYAKPERIYQFYVQHQPDSIYKQGEGCLLALSLFRSVRCPASCDGGAAGRSR